MPKCTINGVEVEVKEGSTIIQAMHENEQKIAHYCWHPGLSVAGVCRLCMVEIEGNPRLQIACNTVVTEGMKINNNSAKVQDAVKWGLDFHLINHPLDCPVCDQAGECGLQDQYMDFGQYTSEMAEPKTKKSKVVDLGPTVVLDSERCILCSRCVRFTDEVSKTHEMGIFNRGDHAEIGTHDGKKLDNPYSLNTVDICPVGALTSKDFRFKQRAWYLKDADTICNGCSTGCNVKVYFNKEGLFRVKPRHNAEVNDYWMCDEGRNVYKFANQEHRMHHAMKFENGEWTVLASAGSTAKDLSAQFKNFKADKTAIVVTGQLTNEDYENVFSTFTSAGHRAIYNWNPFSEKENEFDGLLIRGDKNPNTAGLKAAQSKFGIQTEWKNLESALNAGQIENLIVFGPENTLVYKDISTKAQLFAKAKNLIYCSSDKSLELTELSQLKNVTLIPLKTFIEKTGHFTNAKGLTQKLNKVTTIVNEALTATEFVHILAGQPVTIDVVPSHNLMVAENKRADQVTLDHRKKNEFLFKR